MNGDSIIFIDVEASGLHKGSYPTEVGWCSHDLRRGASYLIRPTAEWRASPWSIEGETVTGISAAMHSTGRWLAPICDLVSRAKALLAETPRAGR